MEESRLALKQDKEVSDQHNETLSTCYESQLRSKSSRNAILEHQLERMKQRNSELDDLNKRLQGDASNNGSRTKELLEYVARLEREATTHQTEEAPQGAHSRRTDDPERQPARVKDDRRRHQSTDQDTRQRLDTQSARTSLQSSRNSHDERRQNTNVDKRLAHLATDKQPSQNRNSTLLTRSMSQGRASYHQSSLGQSSEDDVFSSHTTSSTALRPASNTSGSCDSPLQSSNCLGNSQNRQSKRRILSDSDEDEGSTRENSAIPIISKWMKMADEGALGQGEGV